MKNEDLERAERAAILKAEKEQKAKKITKEQAAEVLQRIFGDNK